MKKIIPILFSIVLMWGCAQTEKVQWDKNKIIGHRFELISTNSVEVFHFSARGSVTATIGTKEALAGPIFSWKLKHGKIIIKDAGQSYVTLEKLRETEGVTEVLRNGKLVKYKVKKP